MSKELGCQIKQAAKNRAAAKAKEEKELADMNKMIKNCKKPSGITGRLKKVFNYRTNYDGSFSITVPPELLIAGTVALYIGIAIVAKRLK